jgi:hypothetical protein
MCVAGSFGGDDAACGESGGVGCVECELWWWWVLEGVVFRLASMFLLDVPHAGDGVARAFHDGGAVGGCDLDGLWAQCCRTSFVGELG